MYEVIYVYVLISIINIPKCLLLAYMAKIITGSCFGELQIYSSRLILLF